MKSFSILSILFTFFAIHPIVEATNPDLTVMIPMRDGIELPADIYLPTPDAKGLPCILLRSPSGRNNANWKSIIDLAREGYAVVVQETRSVLDQEGKTFPFLTDGWGRLQDGYDTVKWLSSSPYTNGKIGTWGASALGITQLLMAPSNPPNLKCQYIIVAAGSLYHHAIFPNGQLLKHQTENWLRWYARDSGVMSYVCHRPFYNEFWKQLDSLSVAHRVTVPGIHVGGWYDTFLQGTLSAFVSRQNEGGEGARGKQKLVVGPWTHFWPLSNHFGDFQVPKEGAVPPLDISPKRWFDHYLKGLENDIEEIPPVIYFVMGPFDGSSSSGNVWRTASTWPVPSVVTHYYLSSNQTLSTTMPTEGVISYDYDPKTPIPTVGGRNLFLESGPKDQQNVEKRDDVVIFTTPILDEDIEVTGNIIAKLFFTSTQEDTDIVVKLCDVYPDGKSVLITEGGYRTGVMCYHNESSQKINPHLPIEINVDMLATSIVFAKGHAIRVTISSSNYPRYERNSNLGIVGSYSGKVETARNSIHFGEKYPSTLLLPVVRQGNQWLIKEIPERTGTNSP